MLINSGVTTVVWVTVTFLTPPTDPATLDGFYNRLKPPGPLWGPVAKRLGAIAAPIARNDAACWGPGVVCIYSALFGVGELLLGSHMRGGALLVVAGCAFAVIARIFHN